MFRITIEKNFDISNRVRFVVFDYKFNNISELKGIIKNIPAALAKFEKTYKCKDAFSGSIVFSPTNDFTWGGDWKEILNFSCGVSWFALN